MNTYEAHLALHQPVMDAASNYEDQAASGEGNLLGYYNDLIGAVRQYQDDYADLNLPVPANEKHLTAATAAEPREWVIISPNDSDEPDVEECSSEEYARTTLARHFQNEPGAFIARRSYVYTPADTEDQA